MSNRPIQADWRSDRQGVSPGWYRPNGRSPTPTSFRPFSRRPEVYVPQFGLPVVQFSDRAEVA